MKQFLILLFLIAFPLQIMAFHDYEKKKQPDENISSLDNMLNSTEHYLKHVYDYINDFSKTLDETLTNEKSDYKYTKSALRFESYFIHKESKDDDIGVNFRVKLRLPQLQEKLKLVIENDDDKIAQKYDDNNERIPYEDNDFNIGLQYDKLKNYYNFRAKGGAKLSSNPYVYLNAKISKKYDLTSSWDLNFEEKIELNTENNFENTSTLSFVKRINGRLSFVNANQYYWDEKHQDDNIYNSLRLMHKLSTKSSLNYVTSVSSNDNNTHFQTKNYDAYIAYKRYIRKWLYYDVVPGLFWEREDNFETKYTFRFNLGILVGK